MPLDKIVTQRLAFIRYLYTVAVEQSYKAEPLCFVSILTFHDAIELFLQLSSEFLNVAKKRIEFMEYWDILTPEIRRRSPDLELTQRESARRLNDARVALKHHGTWPNKLEVESHRVTATSFFGENVPTIFSIEFSDVSLIDMVQCDAAKINLKEAEKMLKESRREEALEKAAGAFKQIIMDYEDRVRKEFGSSPFVFGRDMTFLSSFFMGLRQVDRKMAEFVDKVKESVDDLREAVKILSLGIDYRKYAKFLLLTPRVFLGEKGILVQPALIEKEETPTEDDVRFCIDFVVESALILQEFEFGLRQPAMLS